MAKTPAVALTPAPESIILYKTEGSSDKTYRTQLVADGNGWVVNYQNGRRGGTLRSGTKTPAPVDFAVAKKAYDKLVASKVKDGYTESETGEAYAETRFSGSVTTFRPKLLNVITADEAPALLDQWPSTYTQIKHDGERRGLVREDNALVPANRSGLAVGLLEGVLADVDALTRDTHSSLDAEDMGDHVVVFDVLVWNGLPVVDQPFAQRAKYLAALDARIAALGLTRVRVDIPQVMQTKDDITARITATRAANEEGVVFLNGAAPYTAGRPASGGNALKLKHVKSATVRVLSHSASKRSVSMEVQNPQGDWINVGQVTIPPNAEMPAVGALIEVLYLYAYQGGSLFQPVFKGQRTDIPESAATCDQLIYKKTA